MRVEASKELLSPRADVWALLAEPYHLSDWWPGIHAVRPDRRGLAPGARWEVVGPPQPTLFRSASAKGLLLVRRVEPFEAVAWRLESDRLDVEVRLRATSPDRTLATVAIEGPWRPEVLGRPRRLPREALNRLHALCQTAASL
jgi:uncharacterized protein YndB with AHSA1/START domain